MGRSLRLLIVEDSEDDTLLLTRELRRAGYTVEFERVETAQAMQLALSQNTWDLILSDYTMPQFGALQALEVWKASGQDIPVILMSGTVGEEAAIAALKAGANDFIIKGNFARLGPAIERELREAETRRQRKRAEDALQESERMFKLFVDHAPAAIAMFDRDMKYIAASRRYLADYRLGDQNLIGRSHYEIFPEIPERWKEIHRRCLAGAVEKAEEDFFPREDGTLDWTQWEIHPWYAKEGEIGGIILFSELITERKRAEDALQESEQKYSAIFDKSPFAITLSKMPELSIVDVNDAFLELFEFSRADVIGKSTVELGIADAESRAQIIEELQMHGRVLDFEVAHFTRSGRRLDCALNLDWVTIGDEKHILTTIRDITERRRAERALLGSERRYRALFEDTPIAIWEQDFSAIKKHLEHLKQDGVTDFRAYFTAQPEAVFECIAMMRVLDVNKATLQMYQAESREALLQGMKHLLNKGEWKNFYEDLICIVEGRIGNSWEGSDETLTGKPIQISLNWSVAPGYEEDFSKVIVTTIDITERKQTEEALQESEQKYAAIFDKSPFAITLSKMPEAVIVGVNDAFLELFEFTRPEVIGKTSVELRIADEESRAQVAAELRAHGRVQDFQVSRFTKLGKRLDFALNLDWVTIADKKYVLTTIRDITARKRAEEALQAKNEELKTMSQQLWQAAKLATMGELAASIAHELNNPLATVSLRAEMLQAQITPENPQSKSLQIIDSEIKRMSSLVANLLQFSRRSASQISTIKVNEEVTNTLELIQYHLRKNGIRTVQELSPETPLIQADRQQLRQVFLNLFTNAADAMPIGGILTIQTWSGERSEAGITSPLKRQLTASLGLPVSNALKVFIEVSDTGEGIPPQRLEKVWEPFYTTKPEGKGTGLGLAICRRIIQEHGGSIEVSSAGIAGRGTTVRISLPGLKER